MLVQAQFILLKLTILIEISVSIISDDQRNLDVIAKIREFGVYAFFLICSAAEFYWTEIIQVVYCQYGEMLSEEQVTTIDWSTKVSYWGAKLKKPVTLARQIDYLFKQLWGKVALSGMYHTGQILKFDYRWGF